MNEQKYIWYYFNFIINYYFFKNYLTGKLVVI